MSVIGDHWGSVGIIGGSLEIIAAKWGSLEVIVGQ